jgi:hypothetical protein
MKQEKQEKIDTAVGLTVIVCMILIAISSCKNSKRLEKIEDIMSAKTEITNGVYVANE